MISSQENHNTPTLCKTSLRICKTSSYTCKTSSQNNFTTPTNVGYYAQSPLLSGILAMHFKLVNHLKNHSSHVNLQATVHKIYGSCLKAFAVSPEIMPKELHCLHNQKQYNETSKEWIFPIFSFLGRTFYCSTHRQNRSGDRDSRGADEFSRKPFVYFQQIQKTTVQRLPFLINFPPLLHIDKQDNQ